MGFLGYAAASIIGALLASRWQLALEERLVALFAPPVAFVVVITIATAAKGREWIVFYQATCGAVVAVLGTGLLVDARLWRLLDVTLLGIGIFLAFGRVGCFHVACCHGRPARWGVVYGPAHVAAGLWAPLAGRPLIPVQLIEGAGSLALVAGGLSMSNVPGRGAILYASGYAVLRFGLELLRGDPARPAWRGLSEGQWWCVGSAVVCAISWPAMATVVAAIGLAAGAIWLIRRRNSRDLTAAWHLFELDGLLHALRTGSTPTLPGTTLGVRVSRHTLPDGRTDWILSASHPAWCTEVVRALSSVLWSDAQVTPGRATGVIHVIEPAVRLDDQR